MAKIVSKTNLHKVFSSLPRAIEQVNAIAMASDELVELTHKKYAGSESSYPQYTLAPLLWDAWLRATDKEPTIIHEDGKPSRGAYLSFANAVARALGIEVSMEAATLALKRQIHAGS